MRSKVAFSLACFGLGAVGASTLVVTTPTIAHAEEKPHTPAKPEAKPTPKPAPHAKPTAKPAPKKVASTDPKGAAPKKADAPLVKSAPALKEPAKPKGPCVKAPVDVTTGADSARFTLATCDGHPAPLAAEQLSIVARAGNVAKPAQPLAALAKLPGPNIAPGIRRFDSGLLVRLQRTVDHFAKPGETSKITIVSGYRPASKGSYHSTAHALDFRLDGVTNEALVAFCKTLDDTGCGYYPNSYFVHMDVRTGAGHVSWIDTSGPGEKPNYVTRWPLPKDAPTLALPSPSHLPRPIGPATHNPAIDEDGPAELVEDDGEH
jgi:hypothetical protein